MEQAGALFAIGGIVVFVGFLLVAAGLAFGVGVNTFSGAGVAELSPLVPWGIGLIGFGVMLGFFGAAVKGPSREWDEIAREAPPPKSTALAAGVHYACPGCGGDVYSSLDTCPACGVRLPTVRASGT